MICTALREENNDYFFEILNSIDFNARVLMFMSKISFTFLNSLNHLLHSFQIDNSI